MTEIAWREVTEEEQREREEVRCKATRGPRSRIQCEVYAGHNDAHAARGRDGRWFLW